MENKKLSGMGELSEDLDIEAAIKNKGLEWIGHVV